jgi:hypothetical protein
MHVQPSRQAADRQHRGQGVGEHMDIGGAIIRIPMASHLRAVVALVMAVTIVAVVMAAAIVVIGPIVFMDVIVGVVWGVAMRMSVPVPVIMGVAQQPGAGQVDAQSERRDRDRLAEMNVDRIQEAQHRFVTDAERDHAEDDGAGKRRQFTELAGAKRKARIVDVPPREQIREPGDRQRGNMRAHMPAVGDERYRAEHRAADDFGDHHGGGQRDHAPGAPFVLTMMRAEKGVTVRPLGHGMRMHDRPHWTNPAPRGGEGAEAASGRRHFAERGAQRGGTGAADVANLHAGSSLHHATRVPLPRTLHYAGDIYPY